MPFQVFQKKCFYGPLRGQMNETWKVYKGQYATDIKEISFKEYEPQEANRSVFMSLKRLNKVFLVKRKKASCAWLVDIMWMRSKYTDENNALCAYSKYNLQWDAK